MYKVVSSQEMTLTCFVLITEVATTKDFMQIGNVGGHCILWSLYLVIIIFGGVGRNCLF